MKTTKRRPVHSLLSAEKPDPETAEQREQRSREWLARTIQSMTPAQRAVVRKLLMRKTQPKKAPHRPRVWDDTGLRVLLQMYTAHRAAGAGSEESLQVLSGLYRRDRKTIENALTRARALPKRTSKT